LLLLQALMVGQRKRATGVNEKLNAERAKLRVAAVAIFCIFGNAREVAECFSVTEKTLRRWVSKSAAGAPMGNAPVPGRPPKLTAEQQAELRGFANSREFGTAAKAAKAFWRKNGIRFSKSTAWRALTSDGFAFRVYRPVPQLQPWNKAARVRFAQQHSQDGWSYWSRVMFTDSKYFTVSSCSRRIGHYQLISDTPSTVPTPKRGASLHVYMGCTAFGLTEMIFVSGGSIKNSEFRTAKGCLYKGVCAAEYQAKVLPHFEREGKKLFGRKTWIIQQDGAKIHQTASSLELARSLAPGRVLEPWPALSPDFSPIENVWSMMAERLARMKPCTTLPELWSALEAVRASITAADVQELFRSVPRRLADCIAMGGAPVRF
jgi:transposase